jgi:ABC-2 type transport system permease protein
MAAVIGGALFLTACGMLAYGLGAILRHTAGAVTAALGLLFVVTVLVNFLPNTWQNHVDKWMPAIAGSHVWLTKVNSAPGFQFSAWAGLAVLAGYAAIAIVAGLVLFRTRDA